MARLKRQFDCFDRLPPKLRDVLANAAFDWDATLIAEVLDLGTAAEALAARIAEDDRRRLPVDNYVMYGPEHPGAAAHVPANTLKFYRYPAKPGYWWGRS
ncbi:MAG: DUF6525 family protein [Methylovirgula sp.]